ncbi:hypothetical protein [Hydrotalea sp.]|uniref:hypothetical protein n=1 Tax=Hydrotalea sp. TaxID=2881279 RepID=UPI0026322AC3|nr:hypothetical protein [Hydrotalea sp.]
MKKSYLLVAAFAMSFAAMSFKPKSVEDENLATKIESSTINQIHVSKNGNEAIMPPTVTITVALAETSYAATVAATAAAYNWLFGRVEEATISSNYKAILQDVDMRNLDKH